MKIILITTSSIFWNYGGGGGGGGGGGEVLHCTQVFNLGTCSEAFAVALRSVGAQVNTVLYPDKTHTDLFLQVCIYLVPWNAF